MKFKILLFCIFINYSSVAQDVVIEQGIEKFHQKKYSEAEAIFEQTISNGKNVKIAKEYLGDIAAAQKKWEKAADIFEELVEAEPNNANYNFKYGGALGMEALEMPKIQAAFYIDDIKEHLEKAAQLDKSHIEARWALVKLYLELPSILGGSVATSTKYAQELSQISAVDGFLAKAFIATKTGDLNRAEQHYIAAVQVGNSPHTFEELAKFYLRKKNDPEAAIKTLETAFSELKKWEYAYEIAEISAEENVEQQKGLKYINLYLEKYPNSSEAKKIQSQLKK